jgi:hypothetical protein
MIVAKASVCAAAIPASARVTKNGFPVCTDIGTQLECTAEIAGLGNESVQTRGSQYPLVLRIERQAHESAAI